VVSIKPRPLYPRERAPGTHWKGGRVSPRTDLDDVAKRKFLTLPGLEFRPLRLPARSQSLYRLVYVACTSSHWAVIYESRRKDFISRTVSWDRFTSAVDVPLSDRSVCKDIGICFVISIPARWRIKSSVVLNRTSRIIHNELVIIIVNYSNWWFINLKL
jgi:hypothetical protein